MAKVKVKRKFVVLALAATFIVTIIVHVTLIQPIFDNRRYAFDLQDYIPSGIFSHTTIDGNRRVDADADGLPDDEEMTLNELHGMISKTKGFYVRDWSLWLGWNNVRYIIETSFLHAQLLNRTLVIPSYIIARGCEFHINTCAAYFTMVNRNDALDSDEWRELPLENQMGWKVPIGVMIDIPRLRAHHPVITVSEYLKLYGLNEELEKSKGSWDRDLYHTGNYIFGDIAPSMAGKPSLHVIHNDWYDNDVVRVDSLTTDMKTRGDYDISLSDPSKGQRGQFVNTGEGGEIYEKLMTALEDRKALEWDWAKNVITGNGFVDGDDDETITRKLEENGWEVLYTYPSHGGMEYLKTVIEYIRQVAPRSRVRGIKDDFEWVDDSVLLLEGETHYGRKPGSLLFTTPEARDLFSSTVLYHVTMRDKFYQFASVLAERMQELVGGRNWMGAHMRRGDFVRYGWSPSQEIEGHLQRIEERLDEGRNILIDLHSSKSSLTTFEVPGVEPDLSVITLDPPLSNDPFYLATDERSNEGISLLKSSGAILISDLLRPVDRRTFGSELLITDVLALLEQVVLSHAGFFSGSVLSSVSGGIMNLRGLHGKDPRTSKAD